MFCRIILVLLASQSLKLHLIFFHVLSIRLLVAALKLLTENSVGKLIVVKFLALPWDRASVFPHVQLIIIGTCNA